MKPIPLQPTDRPLLRADKLSVVLDSHAGLVHAVDALRFSIERGETFALVGESGCGKSMTALALMRLLPDNGRISAGSVVLDNEDLLGLPEKTMRKRRGGRIGIIFQDAATSLNPVMRVGDQIVETIVVHTTLRGRAAHDKALEWLRLVGIDNPEQRFASYPFQLSGGQKQRVLIAAALAAEPDLLIADEPTTALDVTIQAQILNLLADLQRRLGMAMLLITHDLAVVSQMAHRVALMYAGQIVELAHADEFFARPLHPYARQLLDALPEAGKRGQALATIAGSVPALTGTFQGCRFADRCVNVLPQCRVQPVAMLATVPGHAVRCILYSDASLSGEQRIIRCADAPHADAPRADTVVTWPAERLLEVSDLHVHFPIRKGLLKRTVGYVKAVDGVSFELPAGHTLALVGESGCGKTTIAKALVQLLRGQAEISGVMNLNGQSLASLQGAQLLAARRSIQIIFQDPFASLDPRMRVSDILEEGQRALRPELDGPARSIRIAALLDQVGLRGDVLTRYPHEFSGGQRQRLAIARALAVEPRLIVCDEPTSALDVSVQAQILNLLKRLQTELGVAYLFISHNIGVVEYLADSLAVMKGGRIVEAGLARDVLENPREDYTRSLLASVPRLVR